MSLKAKIEAVIYASEEPVTLAQLIGLLGQEAQAELDQIAQAQQALALEASDEEQQPADADVDGLNDEIIVEESVEEAAPESVETGSEPDAATEPASENPESVVAVETSAEPEQEVEPASAVEASEEPEGQRSPRESKDEKEKARRLREYFRSILSQLIVDYANGDRGLEIREVAGGFRLATKPEYHDAVRGFVKSLKPPLKLSLQALETLAVVAYKQPITAPEVSEIRGVDSGGVLGSLMSRKLVTTAGRKQVIGRPILYKTTKDFLLRFGLRDINELPSIEEFEKMAGELAEQEEMQMESTPAATEQQHDAPEPTEEVESERHTHLAQADGSPDESDDPLDDPLPEEEAMGEESSAAESEPEQESEPDAEPVEVTASPEPVEETNG
ncbi:MAG TPA: SMC-Scp complex subunit ScpB [Edaphobacter sp.]